jgi:hypothetical protein
LPLSGQHADDAADDGEQDRLGEEPRPNLGPCRTEGAAEADLEATFQNGDDHDVRDADGRFIAAVDAVPRPRRLVVH